MASTAGIWEALNGLDFPADRQAIIDCARRNNAPQSVMDTLCALPDREYLGIVAVEDAVRDISLA